jgi:hypothetical protein
MDARLAAEKESCEDLLSDDSVPAEKDFRAEAIDFRWESGDDGTFLSAEGKFLRMLIVPLFARSLGPSDERALESTEVALDIEEFREDAPPISLRRPIDA